MAEYFILTTSFAAPFVSETDTTYIEAESPEAALELIAARYSNPPGLYAAAAYASADAYHKKAPMLAQWLCNHEQAKRRLTLAENGGYSYYGHGPGDFEINGERHAVEDPKGGSVVTEGGRSGAPATGARAAGPGED